MRVLVTGGAGRLGLKVCKALLRDEFQVRVFELDTPKNRKRVKKLRGKAEVIWGDITQSDSVRQALEGADAVIHMAGILPPVTDQNPKLARRVNIGGTRILVDLLKEKGGHLPFVYTSSIVVFGATPDATEPLSPEKNPPNPEEPYAETKWECEKLIQESGIDYVILRMSGAFDLDMDALKLMYRLPLHNRFEFCHPDNTILALVNAVKNFEAAKGSTLVISGRPSDRMTYGEMLGGAFGVLGLPVPPAKKFSQKWYCTDWYDTSRSEDLLHYQRKNFDDFRREMAKTVLGPPSPVVIPLMRYFIGPVFGRIIVRLL